jgi:hypothetical protein
VSEPETICQHERGADFADNPARFRCLDCGDTIIDSPAQDQAAYIAAMIAQERADAYRKGLEAATPPAPRAESRLREAALALFDPMEHGSPSKPNDGHTVEDHCAACVRLRAKRTQAIRRALVELGDLPSVGLRSPAATDERDGLLREAARAAITTIEWTEGFVVDEPGDGPIETWRRGTSPALALLRSALGAPE